MLTSAQLLLALVVYALVWISRGQNEKIEFKTFTEDEDEVLPLDTAYRLALDHYGAMNWTQAVRYLELSLRLRRQLRDGGRYCSQHCGRASPGGSAPAGDQDLVVHWHVMMKASCLKKCAEHFPVLQLPPPGPEVLEDFRRRVPYRYLHFAHSRMEDLQKAVPCAHTYLQRNPEDQEMQELMEAYRGQYDLSGYLTDLEQGSYEVSFLKGATLAASGDFSRSVDHLEDALRFYLQEHRLCQEDCGGVGQLGKDSHLHRTLADLYVDQLRCRVQCEQNLTPYVGGHPVENFVATMYHYLQYAYYKLNNGRRAAPCASSYLLFHPDDPVMEQNLRYYRAYGDDWDLQPHHLTARPEALKYHNQTTAQKHMLARVEEFSALDAEGFFGAEEAARLAPESPDVEFEGLGDYEESLYAKWWQPPGKGDIGEAIVERP